MHNKQVQHASPKSLIRLKPLLMELWNLVELVCLNI